MVCPDGENFLIRPSSFGQKTLSFGAIFSPQKLFLNNDIFLNENCVPFLCGFHRSTVDFKQKYRIPR